MPTVPPYTSPRFEGTITWRFVSHEQFQRDYSELLLLFGSDQLRPFLFGPVLHLDTREEISLCKAEIVSVHHTFVAVWLDGARVLVAPPEGRGWARIEVVQRTPETEEE